MSPPTGHECPLLIRTQVTEQTGKSIKRDTGLLVENVRSVIVSDAESRSESNGRDVLTYDGGISAA